MIRFALISALVFATGGAWAQEGRFAFSTHNWLESCGDSTGDICSHPQTYDNSDLGKAMAICDRHKQPTGMVFDVLPPQAEYAYESAWQTCNAVAEKWAKTETARKQREAEEQEKRDLEFVKKVAGQ